jgi:hypothetical protein
MMGLLLTPYNAWVELKTLPLIDWLIISKLVETGGVGGGETVDGDFLQPGHAIIKLVERIKTSKIASLHFDTFFVIFLSSHLI